MTYREREPRPHWTDEPAQRALEDACLAEIADGGCRRRHLRAVLRRMAAETGAFTYPGADAPDPLRIEAWLTGWLAAHRAGGTIRATGQRRDARWVIASAG